MISRCHRLLLWNRPCVPCQFLLPSVFILFPSPSPAEPLAPVQVMGSNLVASFLPDDGSVLSIRHTYRCLPDTVTWSQIKSPQAYPQLEASF